MIGMLHLVRIAMAGLLCGLLAGCGASLETVYGSSRGASINGTGVLAEMFRARGHEVRTAFRLTDPLRDWADVIVRFAPHPGLPARAEGDWYNTWLNDAEGRRLVYVVRDFQADEVYWGELAGQLDPATYPDERRRAEGKHGEAGHGLAGIPERVKDPADANDWFRFGKSIDPPLVCKAVIGPWAEGLAAGEAKLSVHESFVLDSENLLLAGDGHPLAMDWPAGDEGGVLAIANGSFSLNATLANPARRALAGKILDWATPGDRPLRVAFAEGSSLLAEGGGPPSIWNLLLRVASFRWVAIQMGILGLVACLARAPRLGRPLPEPKGNVDRPSAHAEALGELLSRTRADKAAAGMRDQYRSWRQGRPGAS